MECKMDCKQIIMNYSVPPSLEDLEVMGAAALESLPDELAEFSEGLSIQVEEIPDDAIQDELDLEDPFELVTLYRSGSQIAPGVTKKIANDDDVVLIFRRPLLDLWCETGEDLTALVRQSLIEELGGHFDFSEKEINEMARRHFQGML